MAKAKTITKKEFTNFGSMKFDSVSIWISKNGNLFYRFQLGKNSMFVAENLLLAVKKQTAESEPQKQKAV